MRALLALALCVCATASGAHGLHVSSGSRIGRSSAQSGQAGEAGSNEAGGQPALAFGRQLLLSNSQVTALLHGNGGSASKQQHAAILSEQQEALRELALELAVTALAGQHRHPAVGAGAAAAVDATDASGPAGSTQRNRDRSREALHYLLQHLPPMDSGKLPLSYLKRNVHLALLARQATRWALHDVPWDMYLNDVLPHASLDEPRDDWRDMMYERFLPLVQVCRCFQTRSGMYSVCMCASQQLPSVGRGCRREPRWHRVSGGTASVAVSANSAHPPPFNPPLPHQRRMRRPWQRRHRS